MKKITTVLFAMLLLTLSVLAVHADQEGNVRWCNIDNDGCYLNEEGGIKSYMYFWTVESCKFFMGNDNPCKNVVPRYYSADGRHPLEPAPEPIDYHPSAASKTTELYTIPVTILQLLTPEQVFDLMFPQGAAEFNGVMIVTDLDGLQENNGQRLVSLEAAGSSKELLIPVYRPKEEFSKEDFHRNFDDFRPMTADLSESGKAALLSGSNVKNSFLIPYETEVEHAKEMNSNLNNTLKENFVLAGFLSSSGVGVVPEEERIMEAKNFEGSNEESSGSGSNEKQSGGDLSVQFSQNEFNKNDDSKSLDTKEYWENLCNKENTEELNKLEDGLFSNVFGAMIMHATGTFENTRPGNDKKTVSKENVDSGSRIPENGLFVSSVKLQSGITAHFGGSISINRGSVSGEATASSGGTQAISIDEGTLLIFNTNDLEKTNPVGGGEGQEGKAAGKSLPNAILDEFKSQATARHFTIPWGSDTQGTKVSDKNFEVHFYKGDLESENFICKQDFNGENLDENVLRFISGLRMDDLYNRRP